jgi:site-specific recombinase XerD
MPISQKLPLLEDFLLFLTTSNYSKTTIRNYERDLLVFEKFLNDNNFEFTNITKKTITIYQADLMAEDRQLLKLKKNKQSAKPLEPKTINRMLTSIRSYFVYLIDNDYPCPLLPQQIKLMKLGKYKLHLPDLETLIQFIEAPRHLEKNLFIGLRNQTILELIFASGMRISEVTHLTIEQINQDDSRILIRGKGNKQRFVYLTPRAKAILDQYLQARQEVIKEALPSQYQTGEYINKFQYVFITKKTFDTLDEQIKDQTLPSSLLNSHISENYLQSKIKSYRLLLNIPYPISAHTLRHGFATYLAESGANPAAIKVLLGHESLETTTKYVHASDNYAKDTHENFHPLKK